MTAYGTPSCGEVTLFLATVALLTPTAPVASLSMLGADVSTAQRALDLGARYYDANGTARDPLDILTGVGVNYARLRSWNNARSGYHDNEDEVLHSCGRMSTTTPATCARASGHRGPRRTACSSATRSTPACCGRTAGGRQRLPPSRPAAQGRLRPPRHATAALR